MSKNVTLDPQIQDNLQALQQYGFVYFGMDENGQILVQGPNGQVVPLKMANEFVQSQIINRQDSPAGIEGVPQIPRDIESATEASIESGEKVVQAKDDREKVQKVVNVADPMHVRNQAPKMKVLSDEANKPWGEGFNMTFELKPEIVEKFIASNIKRPKSSTNKWLATAFSKWMQEKSKLTK